MKILGLAIVFWRGFEILAQAGVPSGQDDRNEGWGGLLGIGIILLAVWMTIVIVRNLSRDAREADGATSNDEGRKSNAERGSSRVEPANATRPER